MVVLISRQIRNKGKHYIHNDKGPTNQDDITILNMYALNKKASKYIKQN